MAAAGDGDLRTSGTLLLRLRQLDDREAWGEFVEQYTPRIFAWCRRYRLQDSDAADVTQEVLGKLVRAIRSFDYDATRGSFRGWLKTVTNNAVRDFLEDLARPGRGSGDTQVGGMLAALQAPDAIQDLTSSLEEEAERELLREAESRVQLRVQPNKWEAYRLTALKNVAASDAATELGMPVSEVYVAKSRVLKLLREEVARLGGSS